VTRFIDLEILSFAGAKGKLLRRLEGKVCRANDSGRAQFSWIFKPLHLVRTYA
jgi:hypothetical protein